MQNNKVTQPGRYLAVVQERTSYVLLKDDQASIIIPLFIEDGQGENSGCEAIWFGGLSSEKQVKFTRDMLKRCFDWDWDGDALADNTVPFAGRQVDVVLEWNDYNGKRTLRASYINNPDAQPEVHDPNKIRSILGALDRQLKAAARSQVKVATPTPVRTPRTTVRASDPIEYQDDDIPF